MNLNLLGVKAETLVRVCESHPKVVEAEGVRLVFEDVVAEGGQYARQQHRHQDGRHCAAGVGVGS